MKRITHFSVHLTWSDHQFEVMGISLPVYLIEQLEEYCTELEELRADMEKNQDLNYQFSKDKPWKNN